MECNEARRAIDRGTAADRSDPLRAALDEHLASCAACRSYHAAAADSLLQSLLAGAPHTVVPAAAAAQPAAPSSAPEPGVSPRPPALLASGDPERDGPADGPPQSGWAAGRWWRFAGLTALFTALLLGGYLLASAGSALFTIQRNVQAMQLPATPALGVAATAPPPTRRPAAAVQVPSATPALAAPPTLAPERKPTPVAPSPGGPITVLLLGIDRRPGETDPSRSDTNIIVRIDPEQHRIAMLSLPRDLIVEIPGVGYARINAAHSYGDYYQMPGGGVELARQTVSNLLGTPIDYVVRVDFEGFIGAVDSIGGIDINVEKELYDPLYPTMDYGYTTVHFLPGVQHLDGATALQYARVRHMDDNFQRNQRQQQVILAVIERLRQQNPLEQLQSAAALTTALRSYIQTDLPEERMVSLAWAFRNYGAANVERYALDGTMVGEGYDPGDPYANYALPGTIEALVDKLMNGPG